MDCGRRFPGWARHALSRALGNTACDSIDLGHRRVSSPDPCAIRLPIFAPSGWGVADSYSFHGCSQPAREDGERYSGLTVDDFPPPKPRATPTTAPAATPTITRILAVSLCDRQRRRSSRGCRFRRGGRFRSRSHFRARTARWNGVTRRRGRRCCGCIARRSARRRGSSVYFAERHLVNVRHRHHFRSPRRRRCVERASCNLHRRAHQIIEVGPLEFVRYVRRHVGQQKMPITSGMVLAENAMQCQLHARRRRVLRSSRGGWILLRRRWVCGSACWTEKLNAFPGSKRATRSPAGLRTSAGPPCAVTLR